MVLCQYPCRHCTSSLPVPEIRRKYWYGTAAIVNFHLGNFKTCISKVSNFVFTASFKKIFFHNFFFQFFWVAYGYWWRVTNIDKFQIWETYLLSGNYWNLAFKIDLLLQFFLFSIGNFFACSFMISKKLSHGFVDIKI